MMTVVKIANNSSNSPRRTDLEKSNVFPPVEDTMESDRDGVLYGKLKVCGEVETDQESTGSSEDMDSPRSVAKVRRWPWAKDSNVRVHSQILRIREEDLHIGDGIGEGLSTKDKLDGGHHHVHVVVLRSRHSLPASPLGSKTAVKMVH